MTAPLANSRQQTKKSLNRSCLAQISIHIDFNAWMFSPSYPIALPVLSFIKRYSNMQALRFITRVNFSLTWYTLHFMWKTWSYILFNLLYLKSRYFIKIPYHDKNCLYINISPIDLLYWPSLPPPGLFLQRKKIMLNPREIHFKKVIHL